MRDQRAWIEQRRQSQPGSLPTTRIGQGIGAAGTPDRLRGARRGGASAIRALCTAAAAIAMAMTAAALPASAQLSAEVQAGSAGIGGGVSWALASELAVRVKGSAFPDVERTERAGGNRYQAHLDLGSIVAVLDWHPTAGGFRISGGALYDGNKVEGDSLPSSAGNYAIGDLLLPASLVGTLHGRIDFPNVAPYAGIGWGIAPRSGPGWGASIDLGVAYLGRPRVTLTPEPPPGSPLNSPAALALLAPALALEEARIEQKIDNYRYFPILAVGVGYHF
jgi:hypothetical protein